MGRVHGGQLARRYRRRRFGRQGQGAGYELQKLARFRERGIFFRRFSTTWLSLDGAVILTLILLQRLTAIGNSNRIANQEAKKKWIESFPPEVIYTANLARRRLARKTDKSKLYLLHDERLPHRGGSGFTLYIKEKFSQSGADTATDAMRTMSERWRSLSPDEKAPYVEEATEQNKVNGEQVKELRKKGELYWKEKLASPSPA